MLPRIVETAPPNYANLLGVFGPQIAKAVFAYGDTIYNPSRAEIGRELYAHERTHCERQLMLGDPATWWETYCRSKQFRFEEELAAHRVEWEAYQTANRVTRRMVLKALASRLSGPLYGRLVTLDRAKQLIRA